MSDSLGLTKRTATAALRAQRLETAAAERADALRAERGGLPAPRRRREGVSAREGCAAVHA